MAASTEKIALLDNLVSERYTPHGISVHLTFIGERADGIVITVSEIEEDIMDDGDNRCGVVGVAKQDDNMIGCDYPIRGQYVQLQKSHSTTALHLAEVEVFGYVA